MVIAERQPIIATNTALRLLPRLRLRGYLRSLVNLHLGKKLFNKQLQSCCSDMFEKGPRCRPLTRRRCLILSLLIIVTSIMYISMQSYLDEDRGIVIVGDAQAHGELDENATQLILFWTAFHQTPHASYTMLLDGDKKCVFTIDKSQLEGSNLVVFYFHFGGWNPVIRRNEPIIPPIHPPFQRWVYYHREPPSLADELRFDLALQFGKSFNTIATHMTESDIPFPYGYYERLSAEEKATLPAETNHAEGRSRLAMAMVSNCGPGRGGYYDNGRMDFLDSMKKLIALDIYGDCGDKIHPLSCWSICGAAMLRCFKGLAAKYKFLFSLENSDCDDYITEKYWQNALLAGMVPIVRGKRNNYQRLAVPGSFVHADGFASQQQLADYLHLLDRNDTLYNEYFAWTREYRVVAEWSNCNRDNRKQDVAFCRYAHEQRGRPLKWRNASAFIEKSARCNEG